MARSSIKLLLILRKALEEEQKNSNKTEGLCDLIEDLEMDEKITQEEESILDALIEENIPPEADGGYYFPVKKKNGGFTKRFELIDNIIDKLR